MVLLNFLHKIWNKIIGKEPPPDMVSLILNFLHKIWNKIIGKNLVEPPPDNYEQYATHLTDQQLAESIRGMGLILGHTRRMYQKDLIHDKDDHYLAKYFKSSAKSYPNRCEKLIEIWESGILDDHQNLLWRPKKNVRMPRGNF